jgi:PAS domain S-box-containing protein
MTETKIPHPPPEDPEEKLRERLLAKAYGLVRLGYWEFNLTARMASASPEAKAVYGIDEEKASIAAMQSVPLPEYRPMLDNALEGLIQRGETYDVTFRIKRLNDGAIRHIHSRAQYDPESNRVFGIIQDITEMKEAEETLRQSEIKYRQIFESIEDLYYEADMQGLIKVLSPSAFRLSGYQPEELMGKPVYSVYANPNDRARILEEIGKKGYVCDFEVLLKKKSGDLVPTSVSAKLILDQQGRPIGLAGTLRDVSHRKQAEREKLRLEEQLRQSQKMEAIGLLAGGIAHDLNNLLAPIFGYAEMLQAEMPSEDSRRNDLGEIVKAGERARRLIQQLMTFGRKQTLEMTPIDLNLVMAELSSRVRQALRENIQLEVNLGALSGMVRADREQFEQIIMNLTFNAQDAMPKGGRLVLSTAEAQGTEADMVKHPELKRRPHLVLRVQDTGIGMTRSALAHLFEPFYTTKEVGKGSGLGLAAAYGMVRQHDGQITVDSELGKGTRFAIYLPLYVSKNMAKQPTKEIPREPQAGNITILHVEPDDGVRRNTATLLEATGYRLISLISPVAAVEAALPEPRVSLLVCEVVFPEMNGQTLYERLREYFPELKALFISDFPHNLILEKGLMSSKMPYLQKPLQRQNFLEKVAQVLTTERSAVP